MKKNNLDELYKEKFKDFYENPGNHVWERIADSLNKKKKKRVIPIWWKLGGVAALLAVVLYLTIPSASNNLQQEQQVVDTENQKRDPQDSPADQIPLDNDTTSKSQKATEVVDNQAQETPANNKTESSSVIEEDQEASQLKATEIAQRPNKQRPLQSQKPTLQTKQDRQKQVVSEAQEDAVALTLPQKDDPISSETGALKAIEENEEVVAQQEEESEKKSIYEAIEEQQSLENAVAEVKPKNKWSMGPTVAPVYFSNLGEGSPIHSNFASNSKSGKVNLSYGLQVNYNLTEKLSIRSGIHKVDFGYDTNDIVFTSSLTTSTNEIIDNITYAQTSKNLVVESKSSGQATFDSASEVAAGAIAPLEGRMVQQLGYLEVPMELNYAVVDKRLGLNIIGGISSLFLVDNAVSLESDELITEMGQANNVNSLNFSTNIGLGVNYEISPKIQINVEPMFKYQLNTFSETAGNFRPYSVGVYSGLNFRF